MRSRCQTFITLVQNLNVSFIIYVLKNTSIHFHLHGTKNTRQLYHKHETELFFRSIQIITKGQWHSHSQHFKQKKITILEKKKIRQLRGENKLSKQLHKWQIINIEIIFPSAQFNNDFISRLITTPTQFSRSNKRTQFFNPHLPDKSHTNI